MAKKSLKTDKDKELIELGRKMQQFFDMGYVNKKQALGFSFLKGIATGLGVFIGGTVIIAIVAWILSFFDQVPLVDQIVDAVVQNIQNNK